MNILFLSHRIPYPPNKGDKIRSFYELEYLSRDHNIFLVTRLEQTDNEANLVNVRRYCKEVYVNHLNDRSKLIKNFFYKSPFSIYHFYSPALQKDVDRILTTITIHAVICFCSSMAEYIYNNPLYIRNGLPGVKLIMDYVDFDSDKWLQYSNYARFPFNLIFKIENKRLFKYEKKIYNSFHHSVFVAYREVDAFKRVFPGLKNAVVISNGINFKFFKPKPKFPKNVAPILLFTGVMDYFANEDGVKWFCENIFPKIKAEFHNVEFFIVGNQPSDVIWSLSEIDGVTVTGYQEDIRKYYWMADVFVAPLRVARGIQNKVLEAMATGNAVVSTPNASEGIVCHHDKDILIADSEDKFVETVIGLLKNPEKRRAISSKAIETIRNHYSWETNLKAFDNLLPK